MASTPKIDLHDGTMQAVGVLSYRRTRAVRRGIVRDISSAQGGLNEALEAVLALPEVYYHPQVPDLPLEYVEAVRFGPTKAWITLVYGWGGTRPVGINKELDARFSLYAEPVEVYRHPLEGGDTFVYGLPAGAPVPGIGQSVETARPRPRIALRQMVRMTVLTTLPFHPYSVVGGIVGFLNSDRVTYAGFTFEKETIRFDGCDVDVLEAPLLGTSTYRVAYIFSVARQGFYSQTIRPSETGVWEIVSPVIEYPTVPFQNAFPTQ